MNTQTIYKEWKLNYAPTQRKTKKEPVNVFITPIAQKYKDVLGTPCSRRDWEEQMERVADGKQLMWDGPSQRLSQPEVGDLMAVWNHRHIVTLYEITHVLNPKNRLESWAANIGQSDRCVVYLGASKVVDWDDWISLGGHSRCMGTGPVVGARNRILDLWDA